MHLFQSPDASSRVFLVGSGGLVGSALQRQMERAGYTILAYTSVTWASSSQNVVEQIISFIERGLGDGGVNSDQVTLETIIWAAGAAGFGSTSVQTNAEETLFTGVLNRLDSVLNGNHQEHLLRFFLISSIGGLFEGQSNISVDSTARPLRPYGRLKLAQEKLIVERLNMPTAVFRLPSVYSFINPKKRMGLIQTMAKNALLRETTSIYGSPSTLRDYVWADDVANSILRFCDVPDISPMPYHFFSGRPISILHIQACIERVLRRSINLSFQFDASNTLNICGNREEYNGFWQPSGLTENIRHIVTDHLQHTSGAP